MANPIEKAEQAIAEMEKQHQSATAPGTPPQGEPPVEPQPTKPTPPQPSTPEPPVGQVTPKPEEDGSYYQRWKTLEGILRTKDARIDQLTEQNNALVSRLDALLEKINQAPAPTPPADTSQTGLEGHLEDLIEEFGDKMIGAMRKVSQTTFGGKIAELEAKIASLEPLVKKVESVETRQAVSEQDKFLIRLESAVPGYSGIMASDAFREWARTNKVPVIGKTFAQVFDEANDAWDFDTMVGVFKAFEEFSKPPAPAPDPREGLVTPGSSGTSSAPTPTPQPKIWKISEINEFYRKATRGEVSDEEYTRISREIDEANLRGLVSPG